MRSQLGKISEQLEVVILLKDANTLEAFTLSEGDDEKKLTRMNNRMNSICSVIDSMKVKM